MRRKTCWAAEKLRSANSLSETRFSFSFHGLVIIGDSSLFFFPSLFAFFKGVVVDLAGNAEQVLKHLLLRFVWFQAILVSEPHCFITLFILGQGGERGAISFRLKAKAPAPVLYRANRLDKVNGKANLVWLVVPSVLVGGQNLRHSTRFRLAHCLAATVCAANQIEPLVTRNHGDGYLRDALFLSRCCTLPFRNRHCGRRIFSRGTDLAHDLCALHNANPLGFPTKSSPIHAFGF